MAVGRLTVAAGLGEADIVIAVPSSISGNYVCAFSQVIPVGGDGKNVLAQGTPSPCFSIVRG